MQHTSSIDPSREPSRPETPSKSNKKAYEQYLQFCQIQANREALKKYDALLDALIAKIASNISDQGGKVVDIRINPVSGEAEIEIKEGTEIKWQKCQELQDLFSKMSQSLAKGDQEQVLNVMLQIAKAQVDPKGTAHPSYQKAFNATIKDVFGGEDRKQEGVEDLTLRLYMSGWAGKTVHKWGQTLPAMQKEALEKMEDQLTTTDDTATPFKDAAGRLSDEIASMDTGQLQQFASPETEKKLHQELLKMIMDSMIAPNVKAALQNGNQTLSKESAETERPKAEEEVRVHVRSRDIIKRHIVDPVFDKEIATIEDVIKRLENNITNLTDNDKQKLAALKEELRDIKFAYSRSDRQEIRTAAILNVLNGIGEIMHFTSKDDDKSNTYEKVQILKELKDVFNSIKSTAEAGTAEMQALLDKITKQIQTSEPAQKLVDDINSLVQRLPNLSREEYAALMQKYIDLKKLKNLEPEIQKQVDQINNAIHNTKVKTPRGDLSLIDMMAASFIATHAKNATMDEQSYQVAMANVRRAIEKIDDPELRNAADNIMKKATTEGIPFDPITGQPLYDKVGKDYRPNPSFAKYTDITIQNLNDLKTAATNASKNIKDQIKQWADDKYTLSYSLSQIKQIIDRGREISDTIDRITAGIQAGQSITDMFRDAILGDYTTHLELALRMLAMQLTHKTFGSKAFGDTASKITNWANINNTSEPPNGLSFDAWYKNYAASHPDDGTGDKKFDIEDLKKMANKELEAIEKMKASGGQARDEIDAKITETAEKLKNGEITKEQADELTKKLTDAKENITKTMGTLDATAKSLKDAMESIKGLTKPAEIREKMKTQVEIIGKSELLAVNGDPDKKIKGLSGLQRDLMTEASNYASQGEALQMKLGQTFTNMQMNYTTITSCMQILNRMISTPIMAVKGQ